MQDLSSAHGHVTRNARGIVFRCYNAAADMRAREEEPVADSAAYEICPVDASSIERAAQLIGDGKLVVIPTDTVYGIACDPANAEALAALFAAKRRPASKSVQVLLSSLSELADCGLSLPAPLDMLARHLCPGGFSPICVADKRCPFATVRLGSTPESPRTQGIRIPASSAALSILAKTGPLATSSANVSGSAPAYRVEQAVAAFGNAVALYLDAGPTAGPVASTVVMADPEQDSGIRILREGTVPAHEIERLLQAGC